jgi:hypothetical protein
VLRPLLRLVAHDAAVPTDSLVAHVGRTREELGVLPVRDPQRAALAELLDAVLSRNAEPVGRAALRMAEHAQRWEHRSAAEAYARCALQLAQRDEVRELEVAALSRLASIDLARGDAASAETHAARAGTLALQLGEREQWARAIVNLAGAAAIRGGGAAALEVLADIETRAREWRAPEVAVIGHLAACRHRLNMGDAEAALEQGWRALQNAPRSAQRLALLEEIISALTTLGLHDEAEHCSALVESRATTAPNRLIVRANRARLRAQAGDVDGFRKRAGALSERAAALPAAARLELARGAFLIGDVAEARRHAGAAGLLARAQLLPREAREAAELLSVLERTAGQIVAVPRTERAPSRVARRIAANLLEIDGTLAPNAL